MKKLFLLLAICAAAWSCDKNDGGGSQPVELTIAFPGGMSYEFITGETRSIAFTITGSDLTDLQVAAEAPETWTATTTGSAEGETFTGSLEVTAPAEASTAEITLNVTDCNGKVWQEKIAVSAAPAPITATDLSAGGYANCYIVFQDGEYMFDATKRGNGKGEASTIALTAEMKADWLWTSKGLENTLTDIRLDAALGRIFVTVGTAGAKGNAVIAMTDAAGGIAWSWHLWITDAPAELTYANGRTVMDRALGASGNEPGTTDAYGLYYQWGRKDPFHGGTTTETSSTAFEQAAAHTVVNPAFAGSHAWKQETGTSVQTQEYAVTHPMSFLSSKLTTGSYDWLVKPAADLWGTEKTCNDPCPAGYKVPDKDTWDDFADSDDCYIDGTTEWDGAKYGVTYTWAGGTDWYPCGGYRNRDKGNMVGLGTTRTGHYWSNSRKGNTITYFYISKKLSSGKLLQPQSSKPDAAYGYNVRCCKE